MKGVKFVGIRDAGDPAECARVYHQQGADELVFLDITASAEARPILLEVVRKKAKWLNRDDPQNTAENQFSYYSL